MNRENWRVIVHGVARVGHNLATKPPPLYLHEIKGERKRKGKKKERTEITNIQTSVLQIRAYLRIPLYFL